MDRAFHKSQMQAAIASGRLGDIERIQSYAWSRGWTLRQMAPGASVLPRLSVRTVRGGHFQVVVSRPISAPLAHPPGRWTYALMAEDGVDRVVRIGQTHALLPKLCKARGRLIDWAAARAASVSVILLEYRAATGEASHDARTLAQIKAAWITAARRTGQSPMDTPRGLTATRLSRLWDEDAITARRKPLSDVLATSPHVSHYALTLPERWTHPDRTRPAEQNRDNSDHPCGT